MEKNLINRIQNGDKKAFEMLMQNYNSRLYGYLFRMTNNKTLTEDLFQDTLIKVWTQIKKYNEQNKFSSWLFTIAHNTTVDELRKKQNLKNIDEVSEILVDDSPQEISENNEMNSEINKIVYSLPEKQKQVFLLRQQGNLPFREIAEIRKEPLNTVLSHMQYAVKKIKKHLRDSHVI